MVLIIVYGKFTDGPNQEPIQFCRQSVFEYNRLFIVLWPSCGVCVDLTSLEMQQCGAGIVHIQKCNHFFHDTVKQ